MKHGTGMRLLLSYLKMNCYPAKGTLDGTEEDALIQTILETAESLCQDIVKVGICYGVTYLYENREKADFDELTRMLKFLLYSVRKEEF